MKKIVILFAISILFFNIYFAFSHYFQLIDFLYLDLSDLLSVLIVNIGLIVFDVLCVSLFYAFKKIKMSYFSIVFIGLLLGTITAIIAFYNKKYEINNYLSIISFSTINFLFFFYSLYFDASREKVFR